MRNKYDIDPIQAAIDDEEDAKDLKKLIKISVYVPGAVVIVLALSAIIITFLLK